MTQRKTKPKAATRSIDRKIAKLASSKRSINARIVQITRKIRDQARSGHCNAASFGWRDDRVSGHGN